MTPAPRTEIAAAAFALSPDRAPAYAAADGAFALYNDYRDGRAVLVRGPGRFPPEDVVAVWQDRPAGVRPLAPRTAVEGYGVFTFPYGPISMGVPEAGRFDVATYGERVLALTPLGGYKSRRVLAGVVGASVADAALRVERTAGNFAAAHVAAFLGAVEVAEQRSVAAVDLFARATAQELQRVYNHVHVLARIAEAASQNVGAAQSHALAEEMLRLQGRVFGHRWLFGALLPGGPPARLDPDGRREFAAALPRRAAEFEELEELFLGSRTFVDRVQGTCPVPRALAVRWGAVGPVLRACGVHWDDRLRAPTPPYDDLFLPLPDEKDGDALARLLVRLQEVRASFLLLEQLVDRWPGAGRVVAPAEPPVAPHRGVGRVEGPSGDLVYDVAVEDGRIRSIGVRTASDANWPLFAAGMRQGVFTDFHFALESFGLVFADTDR
ncbi:MAG TPA: hypothetical protein VMG36_08455 [Thermoplasmata archaeon]|nr:hypothetical protein [Thermoplasmata archaeon]